MIPSVTPPTDNLYKFISLFGLTIFLFAVYNLGVVYDQSADNKMHIESFKVDVQKKLYEQSPRFHKTLSADSGRRFRPAMIRRLDSDLHKIEDVILKSHLPPIVIFELQGQVSKLSVSLDALRLKQNITIGIVIAGLLIMVYGFLKWKEKEQDIRDKILEIEHIIKQKERDGESKNKKKKKHKPFEITEAVNQMMEQL